jgi:hypothetical protein
MAAWSVRQSATSGWLAPQRADCGRHPGGMGFGRACREFLWCDTASRTSRTGSIVTWREDRCHSDGCQAGPARCRPMPGLISSLSGTAGLPPFISFSTSYPELPPILRRCKGAFSLTPASDVTEEFTSVYRMHPLLPNDIQILSARNGRRGRVPARPQGCPRALPSRPVRSVLFPWRKSVCSTLQHRG